MNRLLFYTVFLVLMFATRALWSQVPGLERKVSIHAQKQTIEQILTEIGRQSQCTFSYNPESIGASRQVSLQLENQTVRYALNQLLGSEVVCRERGDFLILQRASKSKKSAPAVVEGYLLAPDGQKLANATVYSASTAVNSDAYGYFRMELDEHDSIPQLRASKQGYEVAYLEPIVGESMFLQIQLPPSNQRLVVPDVDTTFRLFPSFFVNRELMLASKNIAESFQRVVQFSLVPHVGTNSLLSGTTSNALSFNLLGGYVQSVSALEMGAVVNLVRFDVKGFQGAGVANYVGRDVFGFQGAGVINRVGGKLIGFQGAGLANQVHGSVLGFQGAGVFNNTGSDFRGFQGASVFSRVGGYFEGVQSAGVANFAQGGMLGFQGAGILNSVQQKSIGVQTVGVANWAGAEILGVQAAGVFNRAPKIWGIQMSSVLNLADSLVGVQAGIVNVARNAKGLQLGIVNVADTCSGVQVGLFSFVKKGYRAFEVYADEVFQANVAYRSGVRKLHNIYVLGVDLNSLDQTPLYTFGLGFGFNWGQSTKWNYGLDLVSQQLVYGNHFAQTNSLQRLSFNVERHVSSRVSVFAGLTYNLYYVDALDTYYETQFSKIPPYSLTNQITDAHVAFNTWFGLKAGVRLR
jgi:hypothetical protein